MLRQVLHAAQRHAGPGSQRLLRDQKKLHQLYQQLLRVGFSTASVESCLPQMRADATLNDALDWCCLHLPEAALPASFKVSRIGEGADEDSAAGGGASGASAAAAHAGKAGNAPTTKGGLPANAPPRIAAQMAEREAKAKADAEARAKAKAAAAAAPNVAQSAAAFNKRLVTQLMAGGSSDEEEELTDALGILELDELADTDLKRLLTQKTEALEAMRMQPDARAYRLARLERHAAQLEAAIDARLPKAEKLKKEGLKRKAAAQAAREAAPPRAL